MDAVQLFTPRYRQLHERIEVSFFNALTDSQIRCRLRNDVSSIAWLMWHIGRCEDIGVHLLVTERPQVLDDGWLKRLRLDRRDIGTGMSDEEVADFSAKVDITALRGYLRAVHGRTLDVLGSLRPGDLDQPVGPSQLDRVVSEGTLAENAGWVRDNFEGQTKGWLLMGLALTHSYNHYGAAMLVRGMIGVAPGDKGGLAHRLRHNSRPANRIWYFRTSFAIRHSRSISN